MGAEMDRIKDLLRESETITKNKSCDKHGFGFGKDQRFSCVSVSLDSWKGFYGNSGCTNFLSPLSDEAKVCFKEALNSMLPEILDRTGKILEKKAKSLAEKAKEEIAKDLDVLEKLNIK